MIRRRGMLAGLASVHLAGVPLASARAALPVPQGHRLTFEIIRKGDRIGEHSVAFEQSGDALTVSVAVDIGVFLGPICVFRYKHRATERWQANRVVSVEARTNDDGTTETMSARWDKTGLLVEGSKAARYVAPDNSLPGTHWNRAMLEAPFINTQDGRLMTQSVTMTGTEPVATDGGSVQARRYVLRGDANLVTFYDSSPTWEGLRFAAKDGSEVSYRRI